MSEKYVYIVTQGKYSDYHIEAVFLTIDEAKEYMLEHKQETWCGGMHIEEWEIGKNGGMKGKEIYRITLYKGKWGIKIASSYEVREEDWEKVTSKRSACSTIPEDADWEYDNYIVTDRGKDVALKIAQDEFYRIKAERIEKGMV